MNKQVKKTTPADGKQAPTFTKANSPEGPMGKLSLEGIRELGEKRDLSRLREIAKGRDTPRELAFEALGQIAGCKTGPPERKLEIMRVAKYPDTPEAVVLRAITLMHEKGKEFDSGKMGLDYLEMHIPDDYLAGEAGRALEALQKGRKYSPKPRPKPAGKKKQPKAKKEESFEMPPANKASSNTNRVPGFDDSFFDWP